MNTQIETTNTINSAAIMNTFNDKPARKPRKDKGVKRGPKVTTPVIDVVTETQEFVNNCVNVDMVPLQTEEPSEEPVKHSSQMTKTLERYKGKYEKVKVAGKNSADCADQIAIALREATPEEVAAIADVVMGQEEGYHANRYIKLNPGQVRMNSGNRIRSAHSKAIEDGSWDEVKRIEAAIGI